VIIGVVLGLLRREEAEIPIARSLCDNSLLLSSGLVFFFHVL